ncbi:hydrogenase nickel incorporation protein HypB [Pseudomonas nitroreducens]|uniref:Hydrogenase maturation factor HypB n=1 Tax=Pseudomonas nitroreducens TaxID=46680 RepID=A0A6G6IVV1_PSENT|nr:hydrogenase nickel incorporation protein HypB [Pseudomonas nitroreducens]MBG6288720.1 hydrogenase nickel incorporation protein HypB [Pseudomonas nitroreducens]NMZ58737.1 hydrogenase nickel incorporation protein HypB [Pseudomonas nitroreducens]QIE87265.1 hydrogenase nickel incorporation protein HypB [Pseudomonas nitroreducens]SNS64256.1 hydrogenase nickel incorporation protein HypB [Pseudomonas nitroreducens]
MCVVCGCSSGHSHDSHSHPAPDSAPSTDVMDAGGDLHYGLGTAGVSLPGVSQSRTIQIEQDVLGENDRHARRNRQGFESHQVLALNLVSSPGSGKTTLLCATLEALRAQHPHLPLSVIEGDQQTSNDAERIRATGVAAIQVNTGKGCHLDARMVADAYARLPLHDAVHAHHGHAHAMPLQAPAAGLGAGALRPVKPHAPAGILFIENVGNLVCPALWDLGEAAKVAILSVTEGEDKPLKYPDMFAAAGLMLLTKTDLLPHLDFDVQRCLEYAQRVNPGLRVIQLSARNGSGMQAWLDWLLGDRTLRAEARSARIAALEAELAQLKARHD